ncbi:hypothetical protein BDV93DRAFT_523669 [Ceratobasidium sp. AG-I]|nr:hypothetical protein BDV93DRAFT_523669 [Ceratobasidium sp. AG-I]
MPASTSSSGKSSETSLTPQTPLTPPKSPAAEPLAPPLASWTSGTFSFPPCSSRTIRSLPIPAKKETPPPVTTERVITAVPGFDELAEMVMGAESTAIPLRATPAPAQSAPTVSTSSSKSKRRSRHTNSHRHTPAPTASAPKPTIPTLPAPLASLPWSNGDNDAERVTFVFGRLRPYKQKDVLPPPPEFGDTGSTFTTIFRRNHPLAGRTQQQPLSVPDVSPHLAHLRV